MSRGRHVPASRVASLEVLLAGRNARRWACETLLKRRRGIFFSGGGGLNTSSSLCDKPDSVYLEKIGIFSRVLFCVCSAFVGTSCCFLLLFMVASSI